MDVPGLDDATVTDEDVARALAPRIDNRWTTNQKAMHGAGIRIRRLTLP
jgi:hypothetical protein